jgi:hypothetical protein
MHRYTVLEGKWLIQWREQKEPDDENETLVLIIVG